MQEPDYLGKHAILKLSTRFIVFVLHPSVEDCLLLNFDFIKAWIAKFCKWVSGKHERNRER